MESLHNTSFKNHDTRRAYPADRFDLFADESIKRSIRLGISDSNDPRPISEPNIPNRCPCSARGEIAPFDPVGMFRIGPESDDTVSVGNTPQIVVSQPVDSRGARFW